MSFKSNDVIGMSETAAVQNMGTRDNVCIPKPGDVERKTLEGMGVVFGNDVDSVLIRATLPAGWKIRNEKHDSRHSKLLNEKGKVVAAIFLKDSGYDYRGYIHLESEEDEK